MRSLVRVLVCVLLPGVLCGVLVLLCILLLHPPLWSYHPFHPNFAHLPSAYLPTSTLGRWSPSYVLSTLLVPSSYIEGWYLKLRTEHGRSFAVIVFYFVASDAQQSLTGVQLLDAENEATHLYSFPLSTFHSSPLPSVGPTLRYLQTAAQSTGEEEMARPSPFSAFEVRAAHNRLTASEVQLSLEPSPAAPATATAALSLSMRRSPASVAALQRLQGSSSPLRWASAVFSPATHTVGSFAFLPLACYQQVIEMDLHVNGSLTLDGERVDLRNATAYLEKTRGYSFPDQYVWMHATAFTSIMHSSGDAHQSLLSSFFFSIASVPILPTSLHLPGFVCSFLYNSTLYHLSTQDGAVVTRLRVEPHRLSFVLWERTWQHRLSVEVDRRVGRRGRRRRELVEGEAEDDEGEDDEGEEEEQEGWLWAARDGQLKRVIHQQIGLDALTLTWMAASRPHNGSEGEEGQGGWEGVPPGVGVEEEAAEWRQRRWAMRSLFSERSEAVGLEVFVRRAASLEAQLASLYSQVRPWSPASHTLTIHTPLISFHLSRAFVLSILPSTLAQWLRSAALYMPDLSVGQWLSVGVALTLAPALGWWSLRRSRGDTHSAS